jgi:hypothetical protein
MSDVQTDHYSLVIFLLPQPSVLYFVSEATMAVVFQRAVRDDYKTYSSN